MTLAARPESRIPGYGHWLSERMAASLSIWANGGFFDIPNGWVTDNAGIVKMHTHSGGDMDAVLIVNGLTEAETHQSSAARGWCKSTLVGSHATVSFSYAKCNLDWFRFKRIW
ncbi:hypothetical protein CB696_00075 [Salmonella enterica subsp. enterica serovar Livingstone]|nr:hypothetical protein [Salmonella enterica subsp. enterica serovar Livingstone]